MDIMTVNVDLRKLLIIAPSSLTSQQRANATQRTKRTIKKDIARLEEYWDLIMRGDNEKLKRFIRDEMSKATFVGHVPPTSENNTISPDSISSESDSADEDSSFSDKFWGE